MNKLQKSIRIIGIIEDILIAVVVVFILNQFVMAHNKVDSGSMHPTIKINDHLLTNHLPYYYRDPQKGEIVVFNYQDDQYIKRIIATPGDVIDIDHNKVWINGEPQEEYYTYIWESTYEVTGQPISYPYVVPENYYFVLGDNRTDSLDSRYFGPIHRDQIVAKAFVRIYPLNRIEIMD